MNKYPYLAEKDDSDGKVVIVLFSIPGTCVVLHSESDEEQYKFGNIIYRQREQDYKVVDESVTVKITNNDLIK